MENKNHSSWPSLWGARSGPYEQKELPLASQISPNAGFSLDTSGNGIYGLSHAGYLRAARCFDSTATDVVCYGSQMTSTLYQSAMETATIHFVRSCSVYHSFLQGNSPQLVGSASPPTDGGRTTSTGTSSYFCQRFLEIVQQG